MLKHYNNILLEQEIYANQARFLASDRMKETETCPIAWFTPSWEARSAFGQILTMKVA